MRIVSRFRKLLTMMSVTNTPTSSIISSKVSSCQPTTGIVTVCSGFISPGITIAIAPSATTSSSARTLMTEPKIHRKRREAGGSTERVRRTILMVCFTRDSPSPSGAGPDQRQEARTGRLLREASARGLQFVQSVRPLLRDEGQTVRGDVVDTLPSRGGLGIHLPTGVRRVVAVQVRGPDPVVGRADLTAVVGVGDVVRQQCRIPRQGSRHGGVDRLHAP